MGSDIIFKRSSRTDNLPETLEVGGQFFQNGFALFRAVAGRRETGDRRKHLRESCAVDLKKSVAERVLHELPGRLRAELLFFDDALELLLLPGGDESAPLVIDVAVRRQGGEKRFDQIFLVAQFQARID